jgi:hypothetical protein
MAGFIGKVTGIMEGTRSDRDHLIHSDTSTFPAIFQPRKVLIDICQRLPGMLLAIYIAFKGVSRRTQGL